MTSEANAKKAIKSANVIFGFAEAINAFIKIVQFRGAQRTEPNQFAIKTNRAVCLTALSK